MNLARTVPSINEQWFQFKISREIRLKFRIFADSVDYGCGLFYPWWKKEDGAMLAWLFGPLTDAMPPMFESLRKIAWILCPCGQGSAAKRFVRPQMKLSLDAEFLCQSRNSAERVHSVVLPAFTRCKNFRSQSNAALQRMCLYSRDILCANIDRLMKNCDRFEFSDGCQRRAKIGFVAFGVCRRHCHIYVQARFLRNAKSSQTLRWRRGFRLINLRQIIPQRGQTHAKDQP